LKTPLDTLWLIVYIINMRIRKTSEFNKWFSRLRDSRAVARILIRINRLANGNPGDTRFLGEISEMRINYGPGYRVYYKDTGKEIVVLLCGGDKATQQADITRARQIAAQILEEKQDEKNNRI
jgi:putative addiction module killer protein